MNYHKISDEISTQNNLHSVDYFAKVANISSQLLQFCIKVQCNKYTNRLSLNQIPVDATVASAGIMFS